MKNFLAAILAIFAFSSCQTALLPGEKAVRIDNIFAEYFLIANAYYDLQKYDKAAEYYDKAAALKSQRVQATYRAARCYAFLQSWDKSLALYEKLLKADPKNNILRENCAYIYFLQGNSKKSRAAYKELIDSEPDNKAVLQNYTKILIEMKDYKEAAAQIERYRRDFASDDEIEIIEKAMNEAQNPPKKEEAPSGDAENADADQQSAKE